MEGDEEWTSEELSSAVEEDNTLMGISSSVPLPGHKIHSCTDIGWLVFFLASIALLFWSREYAHKNGDLRRLYHGSDYLGRTCGADLPEQYVFWCKMPDATNFSRLIKQYPICVDVCPVSSNTSHSCYHAELDSMVSLPDYPTKIIGKFCVPQALESVDCMFDLLGGRSWSEQIHSVAGQIYRTRFILMCSALIAASASCLYLFLVDKFPNLILYVSGAAFGVIPMASGYFLLKVVWETGGNAEDPETYRNLTVGCFLITIGTFVLLVAVAALRMLKHAVGCIRATCECIMQEPTLLLQPFLALGVRIVLLAFLGHGFLLVLSCGASGSHGLKKQFQYTPLEVVVIAHNLFMLVWLMDFATALSQYSLAWVTQKWYFTPYILGNKEDLPICGIFQGFCSAVSYHPGSLAVGSLLVALFRLPHSILLLCSAACKRDVGCTARFRTLMSTKNAYMDIALTSDRFCQGAERAHTILQTQGQAVVTLNGAQWLYFLTGYAAITSAGAFAALGMIRSCTSCLYAEDQDYVTDPFVVVFCAALISFFIAQTFMVVFDVVGDTILYCFVLDQSRKQEQRQLRGGYLPAQTEEESWSAWLFSGGIRCATGRDGAKAEDEDEGLVSYTPEAVKDLLVDKGGTPERGGRGRRH
mmetsp:Transcript_33962/g.90339  ORF Transcript_33962/g.90339 Transcript_33962/m.90339 type:complete len:643 (+) Transcript_33962:2-1930(+)